MTENGIGDLELLFDFGGIPKVYHPVLIWDDDNVALVDAGYPGQFSQFREAVEQLGIPFDRINRIIVTHHDWDHVGSLAAIVDAAGGEVEVLAHGLEQPYIQGDEVFVKSTHRDAVLAAMPRNPQFGRVRVTRLVADGEELPLCGGIVVVHVPGHTPGHICLYHKRSRTLITGDALNVVDGKLLGPNPRYTHDLAEATVSLKKLARCDIRTVICYHGGVFTDDVNRRIAEIAAGRG